jgi:hypothetical protein
MNKVWFYTFRASQHETVEKGKHEIYHACKIQMDGFFSQPLVIVDCKHFHDTPTEARQCAKRRFK